MKTKQPQGTRVADTKRLQQIMHYHGAEQFLELLREAYFQASDETEYINKETSARYNELANQIEVSSEN